MPIIYRVLTSIWTTVTPCWKIKRGYWNILKSNKSLNTKFARVLKMSNINPISWIWLFSIRFIVLRSARTPAGPTFLSTADSCDENEKSDLEWARARTREPKDGALDERMKDKREGKRWRTDVRDKKHIIISWTSLLFPSIYLSVAFKR